MIKKIINNFIIFGGVVLAWWLAAYLNFVSKIILPWPQDTFIAFFNLFSANEILDDLFKTIYRTFVGLGLGIIFGVSLGLLLGMFKKIYHLLEFWIDLLRSIPPPTLIPLFLLFFGIGDNSKIFIAAFVSTFIITVNTIYGIHNINKNRLMFSRTIQMSRFSLFTKVILLDALPYISLGVRLAISFSLVLVIVGEMLIGANAGLGRKIVNYHLVYDIPEMYATIILTGLIGYLLNKLYLVFEKKYIHWQGR